MSNEELISAFKDAVLMEQDTSKLEKELLARLDFSLPKWELTSLCNNAQQQWERYKHLLSYHQ